ncbi:hypothetical protein [Planococcus faecalis]|uniref:Uncharacterized protein n=1 Tax=Planococcus faecalis TaxID=1598147 RepID=A0ABM6IP08_9BACL|nr:hypothetical protein [Planococcus faecalis]AQU78313.1 hypothetical protein AJGP001_02925 [Planococcus faecalis]OHX51301.1 hypothetical protein BB777_17315 [Planococcus faecalis]
MTTFRQIKAIQERVRGLALNSKVYFFDSSEEYEEAVEAGRIGDSDVCIIDDILNDEISILQ